jgi:hypothetical protein
MAMPLRCAVSLRLTEKAFKILSVYDLGSETLRKRWTLRQVRDLPRIGVA